MSSFNQGSKPPRFTLADLTILAQLRYDKMHGAFNATTSALVNTSQPFSNQEASINIEKIYDAIRHETRYKITVFTTRDEYIPGERRLSTNGILYGATYTSRRETVLYTIHATILDSVLGMNDKDLEAVVTGERVSPELNSRHQWYDFQFRLPSPCVAFPYRPPSPSLLPRKQLSWDHSSKPI